MLNPNKPNQYSEALIPPFGMELEVAVATTYSINPAFVLEACVHLSSLSANDKYDIDPIVILTGLSILENKITIYTEHGESQVPPVAKTNPLLANLDRMVISVKRKDGGIFHPKVWALKYVDPDQNESALYRLLILTRNMTYDRSWDTILKLDGRINSKKQNSNNPLNAFFKMLPNLAEYSMEQSRKEQTLNLADELNYVIWELPENYEEIKFYLPWMQKYKWEPPQSNHMLVISPFCSNSALDKLTKNNQNTKVLISRPETLMSLNKSTLKKFNKCYHLNEYAEIEDGEDCNDSEQLIAHGLHTKMYLFETQVRSEYTHLVMGSSNATTAGLSYSKNADENNIEILVELTGRKDKIGGIKDLLGANGIGNYLLQFTKSDDLVIDNEGLEAEKILKEAKHLLVDTELSIKCKPGSREGFWELILLGKIPHLDGIASISAWPITVNNCNAVILKDSEKSGKTSLGEFSLANITGYIAFELKIKSYDDILGDNYDNSIKFSRNLSITGIPSKRKSAIFNDIINDKQKLFNHIVLFLGFDGVVSKLLSGNSSSESYNRSHRYSESDDYPLLETMIRVLTKSPHKIAAISSSIKDLVPTIENSIVPEDYLNLLSIFEEAISEIND
ncbi:MAG: phospholipase D family protein [Deltaproteobacteria bacterium]|jgi:hypothetical protein|nr:phospholipase D family protein [Deltaproteobacteria bacterium]